MKKTILYLSLIAAVSVTASSCKDFLDQESSTAVSTEEAITSYTDAETAMYGVYDIFQEVTYYGTDLILYGSLRGESMQSSGFDSRGVVYYDMAYTGDNGPTTAWQAAYIAIRRANNLIQALDAGKAVGGKEADIANLKGQALVLRALAHFDLSRLYCLPYTSEGGPQKFGIPVVTTPSAPSAQPGRGTLEEVYTQVLKDLNDAAGMLYKAKKTGFVNYWVAKGLLSRVYLYKGDYVNALAAAEAVILDQTNPYTLWANDKYTTSWNIPGSSELMFEIINQDTQDWGDREAIGYLMAEDGYGSLIATPKLSNYFKANPGDVRGGMLLAAKGDEQKRVFGDNKVYCNKYPGRTAGDSRLNNLYALRLSEVYLNAAEAAVMSGATDKGAQYLNTIQWRANPDAAALPGTIAAVRSEREKELFGEGHDGFDMMRWELVVDRSVRYNYPALRRVTYSIADAQAFLAIPLSERNSNPTLSDQKNPGY